MYKEGDKIVCIKGHNDIPIGTKGEVVTAFSHIIQVRWQARISIRSYAQKSDMIEKDNQVTMDFKKQPYLNAHHVGIGAKVEIMDNQGQDRLVVGEVYEVARNSKRPTELCLKVGNEVIEWVCENNQEGHYFKLVEQAKKTQKVTPVTEDEQQTTFYAPFTKTAFDGEDLKRRADEINAQMKDNKKVQEIKERMREREKEEENQIARKFYIHPQEDKKSYYSHHRSAIKDETTYYDPWQHFSPNQIIKDENKELPGEGKQSTQEGTNEAPI